MDAHDEEKQKAFIESYEKFVNSGRKPASAIASSRAAA
jgi:hypothetical protein